MKLSKVNGVNEPSFEYYRRLRRVREFVEQSYTEPISLGIAAQVAGMEKKAFSRFFREKAGIPFSQWLSRIRVEEAKKLLQTKNYSVTEVAFAVGYQDLTTFERAFKRLTRITPRDFKRSVRPA